tara:strand:- start:330 stop:503 length:174 start_codon:yes stop_codon:yes gene_type:complete
MVPLLHSDIDEGNIWPYKLTCSKCGKVLDRDWSGMPGFIVFIVALPIIAILLSWLFR